MTRRAWRQATSGGTPSKGGDGEAQLVRIGHVLGVVDDRVRALGERQGDVEGARLGFGKARGGDEDLDEARQLQSCERLSRFAVVGLDHEFDVELRRRVIERATRRR